MVLRACTGVGGRGGGGRGETKQKRSILKKCLEEIKVETALAYISIPFRYITSASSRHGLTRTIKETPVGTVTFTRHTLQLVVLTTTRGVHDDSNNEYRDGQ